MENYLKMTPEMTRPPAERNQTSD